MGMQDFADMTGEAKDKADRRLRFGLNFKDFINVNEADVLAIKADYIKPDLTAVTDDEIRANFGIPMTDEAVASEHLFLEVAQDMIDTVKGIKDKLPANDIGA